MISGFRLDYSLRDEPAKTNVKAWNDSFRGKTECYVNYGDLNSFASSLKQISNTEHKELTFGRESKSSSYWMLQTMPVNTRGHFKVTIKMANGDYEPYRSESTICFVTDLVSLISFSESIHTAIQNQEGFALLGGIS